MAIKINIINLIVLITYFLSEAVDTRGRSYLIRIQIGCGSFVSNGRPVISSALCHYPTLISTQVDGIWMFVHSSNCLKSKVIPAWVASAINYFFSARSEGQQLASARCPGLTVFTPFFDWHLFIDVYSVSCLWCKKQSTKRRKTVRNRSPHKWPDCVPLMA